ncbi:MAG: Ig-like domain-containing protein [Verrucomicrobia bacterium]|nr:Ig-like domain-containing protein [Verrucomicrobiota bacterium]
MRTHNKWSQAPRLACLAGVLGLLGVASQAQPILDFEFNERTADQVADSINGLTGAPAAEAPTSILDSPSGDGRDRAIHFEPGQYILVPDPETRMQLNPDDPSFTVQAWVKFSGMPATRQVLFYSNGPGGAISFSINTDRTVFVTTLGILDASSSAVIPDDGQWHHIAVVHENGVELRYYVDGVLSDAREYTDGVIFTRTQDFFSIGAEWNGGLQYVGSLDRLKVSSGALSADQLDCHALTDATQEPPSVAVQPQDATVNEGSSVEFSATFEGSAPMTFEWFENGVVIPGANSPFYTIDRVSFARNGATFKCVGTNPYGTAATEEATLTVVADTTPPTLDYATGSRSFTEVTAVFSEPLDPATAEDPANYALSGGVTVTGAALAAPAGTPGDNIVLLTTSEQTPGTTLTLTVNNVTDVAGNPVAPDTSLEFGAFRWQEGLVLHEYWENVTGGLEGFKSDPRYPDSPSWSGLEPRTEYPRDGANEGGSNYGNKLSCWVVPQKTDNYVFFVSSDDPSELYLSPDEDPANAVLIAQQQGWTGPRIWRTAGGGGSDPLEMNSWDAMWSSGISQWPDINGIHLEAGKKYYLYAIHTEAGGGDNLAVTMVTEDDFFNLDIPQDGDAPTLEGPLVGTYIDPNTQLRMVSQPTDQVGVLASEGVEILSEDFDSSDGGYTVVNTDPAPPGPWAYDGANGQWVAVGSEDACTGPYNSQLSSPPITLPQAGAVTLSFTHRYSFEGDLWDAGLVRVSVNGGEFTLVPAENFTANGYAEGAIIGSGIANGLRGFNGDSPGYDEGEFITSKAVLGTFKQNDTIVVQFVGAWDDCATGKHPNWVIDSLSLRLLPMAIADFADGDGGYTVVNSDPAPPGPWEYDSENGQWVAAHGNIDCGDPNYSILTSPSYTVTVSDEVTVSFQHRYAFEGDLWDGGQLRMSVNGGEFVPVPREAFRVNGYAEGVLQGNGILKGQPVFNGKSAGYDEGEFITSTARLGTFNEGDTIALQFVCNWDECSTGTAPNWVIKRVELTFGKSAEPVRFSAEAEAALLGEPVPVVYQWQRNDGAGFEDIVGATGPAYTFYPVAADFNALFRVVVTVPTDPSKSLASEEVKLLTAPAGPPTISIEAADGAVTIEYTGTLQSAEKVTGPYENVEGASSPYTVPVEEGKARFYRSVR